MASQGFRDWLTAGSPYSLIACARALARTLGVHGFTVWHYPDYAHQVAEPPEDHTPYSETGYPGVNRRWNARGLDVMPRGDTAAARRELASLSRRIIADKSRGIPGTEWIKYINWTDEFGICRQERWTPDHVTRSSTDRGHTHISGRADADDNALWTARAALYNPFGSEIEVVTDDDVRRIAQGVWELFRAPVGPDGTAYNMQDHVIKTEYGVAWLKSAVTVIGTDVKKALELLEAGGGNADVVAILAGVQGKLDTLRPLINQDVRDTLVLQADAGSNALQSPVDS